MTVMALAWLGCGQSGETTSDGGADLAVAVDLAQPPPDLAAGGGVDLGYGTNTDGGLACIPPPTAMHAKYVWNAVTVPMSRTDFAWDLNGDGRVDNQYGNIVAALAGNGLDPQTAIDQALAAGQSITLFDEQSKDATFMNDSCAATATYAGTAMASPDYSGNGHFTIDATATVGRFSGPIVGGQFTSDPPPANAKVPSTIRVPLPLFGANAVDLIGARITYTRGATGKVTGGQVNGAIRKYDIDHTLVPNVAAALNAEVQANPSSSTSMQLLSIFDTGGTASAACGATCQNLDGSCAKANDGKISDCEVGTNGIIKNVLAPDVQMFDANGNYDPQPANTDKDCLSVGMGFTAVGATF